VARALFFIEGVVKEFVTTLNMRARGCSFLTLLFAACVSSVFPRAHARARRLFAHAPPEHQIAMFLINWCVACFFL